jgi:hypothetical protein
LILTLHLCSDFVQDYEVAEVDSDGGEVESGGDDDEESGEEEGGEEGETQVFLQVSKLGSMLERRCPNPKPQTPNPKH